MELGIFIVIALAVAFLISSMFGDSKPGQDRGDLFFPESK